MHPLVQSWMVSARIAAHDDDGGGGDGDGGGL